MQHYFAKDKNLTLDESDYFHIKKVMRMKVSDEIVIIYDDVIYHCIIDEIKDKVKFKVISEEKKINNNVKITCAFSLIKEQKQDFLIQKTVEEGVFSLIPINTKRSIIKIDKKKEQSKIDRWKKIAKEASEQSFRHFVPNISNILDIKDLVNLNYDLKLICTLNKNTKNIKKVLQNNNKYDTILIVTGPEGGFENSEEGYLINNGFIPVSLGDNVLRSETAPICAIAMINYEYMR